MHACTLVCVEKRSSERGEEEKKIKWSKRQFEIFLFYFGVLSVSFVCAICNGMVGIKTRTMSALSLFHPR